MNSPWWVYLIGFLAQVLFSARLLVQWIHSEKMRKVMTPKLFWELSLVASFLMFLYGWLRDDFAIMLGQTLGYFIYIRNMQLQNSWYLFPYILRLFFLLFPVLVLIYAYNNNQMDTLRLFHNPNIPLWLLLWGSLAQIIFIFRFVYQWFLSERIKKSHLPLGFWYLSLSGSLMILIYALFRRDPILFLGQSFGFIIYIRNIWLYYIQNKGR